MERPDTFPSAVELTARLPPIDPDEPTSLRDNIVAEVRDHLLTSLRRELLKHELEYVDDARRIVLNRFGDPAVMVHRLWLSAMWSRLMIRHLTLGTSILALAAGLTAVWLVHGLANEFRRSAEATRSLVASVEATNRELLDQSREQSRLVVDRLTTLAIRPQETDRSATWNPLTIRLVADDADQSAAVGFTVEIKGNLHSESVEAELRRVSNELGIIDFGLVRPGNIEVEVITPWQSTRRTGMQVLPATEHVETIQCPASPPAERKVELVIDWPAFFKDRTDVAVLMEIREGTTSLVNGDWRSRRRLMAIVSPDGSVRHGEGAVNLNSSNSVQMMQGMDSSGTGEEFATTWSPSELSAGTMLIAAQDCVATQRYFIALPEARIESAETNEPYVGRTYRVEAPSRTFAAIASRMNRVRGYGDARSGSDGRESSSSFAVSESGLNRVVIPLDPEVIRVAHASLLLQDQGITKSVTNLMAAVEFVKADDDGDGSVTSEEFEQTSLNASQIARFRDGTFPCSLSEYIERYKSVVTSGRRS